MTTVPRNRMSLETGANGDAWRRTKREIMAPILAPLLAVDWEAANERTELRRFAGTVIEHRSARGVTRRQVVPRIAEV